LRGVLARRLQPARTIAHAKACAHGAEILDRLDQVIPTPHGRSPERVIANAGDQSGPNRIAEQIRRHAQAVFLLAKNVVVIPALPPLFYRIGDGMMAVPVTTQPSFSAGRPTVLFRGTYLTSPFPLTGTTYDVTRDRQRFVMIKDQATSATQINVVVNSFEELKRLVPIDRAR
jgi:hypothetical protein